MAQALPRYCPRCGTPTRANMSYCATCELPVEAMQSLQGKRQSWSGEETAAATQGAIPEPAIVPKHMQQEDPFFHVPPSAPHDFLPTWNAPGEVSPPSQFPPAPPVSPGNWNAPPNQPNDPGVPPWVAQAESHFSPMPQPWDASGNPPPNAGTGAPWSAQAEPWQQPAKSPAPQPKSRRRMGIVLLLLAALLVLGGGGYLAISALGVHVPGFGNVQSTIKTSKQNTAVTYAGMTVTVRSIQQAQNFLDDPQTANDGMVRLNLQEQNTTTVPISWDYNASARLIVQGKPAIAPTYVKSKTSIAPGTTQTSVVDFAVPNGGNLSSMVFQLGSTHEAQMQIPLAGTATLSQYQPQTTKQNGTTTYFGLNWTLTGSTTSLSIPGQQASSGMEYLTLKLTVDSALAQEAISGSPFDYLNVKAGGQTAKLISTTVPVSFAAGATGKTGTATFLIPQNSTSCTLLFLSQDPGGSGQASIDFKI